MREGRVGQSGISNVLGLALPSPCHRPVQLNSFRSPGSQITPVLGGVHLGKNALHLDFRICKVRTHSNPYFTPCGCKYRIGEGFVRPGSSARIPGCDQSDALAGTAGSQSGSRRFTPDSEGGDAALPLPAEARSPVADSPAAARAGPSALHSPQGVGGSGPWPPAARPPRAYPGGRGGGEVPPDNKTREEQGVESRELTSQ